jgi:hypothetical protein
MKAHLNANDNTWSVSAESEEECFFFLGALNNALEHIELDTVEKIEAWKVEQAALQGEEDEE